MWWHWHDNELHTVIHNWNKDFDLKFNLSYINHKSKDLRFIFQIMSIFERLKLRLKVRVVIKLDTYRTSITNMQWKITS